LIAPSVNDFPEVVQTIDKINKACTLLLTPEKISLIVNADVVVWASLAVVRYLGHIFENILTSAEKSL